MTALSQGARDLEHTQILFTTSGRSKGKKRQRKNSGVFFLNRGALLLIPIQLHGNTVRAGF
jgi:hypothetical protein